MTSGNTNRPMKPSDKSGRFSVAGSVSTAPRFTCVHHYHGSRSARDGTFNMLNELYYMTGRISFAERTSMTDGRSRRLLQLRQSSNMFRGTRGTSAVLSLRHHAFFEPEERSTYRQRKCKQPLTTNYCISSARFAKKYTDTRESRSETNNTRT